MHNPRRAIGRGEAACVCNQLCLFNGRRPALPLAAGDDRLWFLGIIGRNSRQFLLQQAPKWAPAVPHATPHAMLSTQLRTAVIGKHDLAQEAQRARLRSIRGRRAALRCPKRRDAAPQAAGIEWRIELRDDRQRGCRPAW